MFAFSEHKCQFPADYPGSRNRYLSPADRNRAGALPRLMRETIETIESGGEAQAALADLRQAIVDEGFDSVDYVALADADSLERLSNFRTPARLLGAARIGKTRLIDNLSVA